MTDLDKQLEALAAGVIASKVITREIVLAALRAAVERENERCRKILTKLEAVVAALPKCSACDRPATLKDDVDVPHCDVHGGQETFHDPDLPYATAVRALEKS